MNRALRYKLIVKLTHFAWNYRSDTGGRWEKSVHGFKVDVRPPNKLLKVLIDDPDIYEDEEVGYIGYNETKEQIMEVMYIDNNGKLLNALDFTLNGIWFDYRIADELPLNYRPERE